MLEVIFLMFKYMNTKTYFFVRGAPLPLLFVVWHLCSDRNKETDFDIAVWYISSLTGMYIHI